MKFARIQIEEASSKNDPDLSFEDPNFLKRFISAVKYHFDGLERDVFLVILNMLVANISDKLSEHCSIPLNRFKSPKEVLAFVTALIETGVASQTERSVVFVMGNTNTGKTSLVNTLKDYIDQPSEEPRSVLTEEHSKLLETQVMELYDSVSDPKEQRFAIHVDEDSQRPTLISFRQNNMVSASGETDKKPVKIKVVDMGGHHEYYTSSTLFVAGNGLFLVCFDSSNIEVESDQRKYYSSIGCYVDLIFQVAAKLGVQPKIALVATKVEGPRNLKEAFDKLLELTKSHLSSRDGDSFLVNGVLETSSKHVTKEGMEEIHQKINSLCRDASLTEKPIEKMPQSWFELLELMKTVSSMTLERIEKLFENIKKKKTDPQKGLQNMDEFKEILLFWILNHDELTHRNANQNAQVKVNTRATVTALPAENNTGRDDFHPGEGGDVNCCLLCCALPFLACALLTPSRESSQEDKREIPEEEPEKEMDEELGIVLNYFMSRGELLWFRDHFDLSKTVISQPMEFVKALRTVISHKFVQNFEGVQLEDQKSELLQRGLLSFEDFQRFYKSTDQSFSEKEIWHFLIELNLACSLGEDHVLVPCLITDKMEGVVRAKEEELSRSVEAIRVQYKFDHNSQSIGKYHQVLSLFIKNFVWGEEKGGNITHAFSQKVEERELGIVGGVGGILTWLRQGDVQNPDEFEFQITEIETSFKAPEDDDANTKCHAVHRAIQISLRPTDQKISKATFEIVKRIDELVSEELGQAVRRSMICKDCQMECKTDEDEGDFLLKEGMDLKQPRKPCSNFRRRHRLQKEITTLIQRANPRKEFELQSLMAQKKETLGLEAFKDSEIKRQLETGSLNIGEQIWIYHDTGCHNLQKH